MNRTQNKLSLHLYDLVKKKVDLSEFLETEIGCVMKWYEPNISAGTICPMPHHKDSKPSFRIKFIEEDSLWIFHCLGCGAKGTIIDFFMEYYRINNSAEAVLRICKKFGFDKDKSFSSAQLNDIKKKVDFHKKLEYTHIVTSNQCRMLLQKDISKYSKWIGNAYRKMNDAMDKEDIRVIEEIASEAHKKLMEKKDDVER